MDGKISLATLEATYRDLVPRIDRFRAVVAREVDALLTRHGVDLSVPLQHRTKTWSSLVEKIERRGLKLKSPLERSGRTTIDTSVQARYRNRDEAVGRAFCRLVSRRHQRSVERRSVRILV